MRLQRDWVTPLTMGAFGPLAVTGVLMFFHADTGLNKTVHEWLSWVLLAGVGAHAAVNWAAFRRHLAGWRGRSLLAVFAIVLAASFVPLAGGDEPPFVAPVRALADAPLPVLAQVARTSPDTMRERLARAGYPAATDADSVARLVGPDTRAQTRVLATLVKAPGG